MFELSDENNLDGIPDNVISKNQINDSFDDLTQSVTENLTVEQLENLLEKKNKKYKIMRKKLNMY